MKPFSFLPTLEHLIRRVEFHDTLTPATLLKSSGREMIGNFDSKRYPTAKGDLAVENPDSFGWCDTHLV